MPLLDFTKPTKVKVDAGFDGGPDGGYMPQMDQADAARWKAKHFNLGKDNARVELRKSFDWTQLFIIVALDGWDLGAKHEYRRDPNDRADGAPYFKDTHGLNVRISMNGPLLLTFEQFAEINQIVNEAHNYLLDNRNK